MTRLLRLALFTLLPFAAWAQETTDADDDDLHENTVSGPRLPPPKSGKPIPKAEDDADDGIDRSKYAGMPYAAESYIAAEILKVDVAFADKCRKAIDLIYQRNYKDARTAFDALTAEYPTTGIGPSGMAIIFQALMFENFDFRYEKQYEQAYTTARKQIDAGLKTPGNEAIEYFLLAGMTGIDAIHVMRKGQYVAAFGKALDAIKALKSCKDAAPAFVDPWLGDGMYYYWRTIVVAQSKLLPKVEDKRDEGFALMRKAEKEGVFLGPAATLGLIYSYIEEREMSSAKSKYVRGYRLYPDNVINNMTGGRIYTATRDFPIALRAYADVLRVAPDNQRVHYHRGIVYFRQGEMASAEQEYKAYLAFRDIPADYRGQTLYRLGTVAERQKNLTQAKWYYDQAIKTNGSKASKKRLEKLKKSGG
jgi:tetratricopeptide (TPR) repeat protein